jgi:hypothetical protein
VARAIDLSVYSSEPVEVEIDGQTYAGIRFYTGAGVVRQEVHFGDLSRADPRCHRAREVRQMRLVARAILRSLVAEWKAQAALRPVPVRPDAKPRWGRARG